jgi:hypothetical protein
MVRLADPAIAFRRDDIYDTDLGSAVFLETHILVCQSFPGTPFHTATR